MEWKKVMAGRVVLLGLITAGLLASSSSADVPVLGASAHRRPQPGSGVLRLRGGAFWMSAVAGPEERRAKLP